MFKNKGFKRIFIITLLIGIIVGIYLYYKWYGVYNILTFQGTSAEDTSQQNLEQIYPPIAELREVSSPSKFISLIAVGDFLLDRNVGNRMKEINDYYFPIRNTKDLLESADITFCNVECPICEGRKIGITETSFRADPETVQTLVYGGFDIVSLANNHTMNFGGDCLVKTFSYLNEAGIDYVGAGSNFEDSHKPLIKTINVITLAFMAYNDSDVVPSYYFANENSPGTNKMDIPQLQRDVEKIHNGEYGNVDLIILSMHSGTEYTAIPNQRQIQFARAAVDAGVDIVLGHHPHNVQHIEQYKGKYIIYSMGNFVLDQMRWVDCTKELLLNITISKKSIFEVEVIPIRMKNFCETNIAEGYEKQEILEIINYETVSQPYIYFDDNEFKISQRDILKNNDIENNTRKTSIKNKNISWAMSNSESLNVVFYENVLYIIQNESIIWSSNKKMSVSDFEIGDFDNDNLDELLVSYWEEEESRLMNKISMFKYTNQKVTEVWKKETEDTPIIDIEISDIDKNGDNDIVLIEGNYNDFKNDVYKGNSVHIYEFKDNELSTKSISDICNIENVWINRNMVYLTCSEYD